jgi:DNA-binding transcriptional MerR regulator
MAGSGNSEVVARERPGGRKSAAAFRTISEVAGDLDVAQHVLRFWESKFPQVRPLKRGGGRRYYRPEDVDLLRQIRSLLYDEGYTIKGAQKLLKGQRRTSAGESDEEEAAALPLLGSEEGETGEGLSRAARRRLARLRTELMELRRTLLEALG